MIEHGRRERAARLAREYVKADELAEHVASGGWGRNWRKAAARMTAARLVAWLCLSTLAAPGFAAETGATGTGRGSISTRLTIGARFTHYRLEESRRSGENGYDNGNLSGNFLGSLWGLDAQQHYYPNPYVEYQVVSGVGVGVMYDALRVRTLDWANADKTATAGDGHLEIRGAVAGRAQLVGNHYRVGAFPMRYTAFTLGVAYAF